MSSSPDRGPLIAIDGPGGAGKSTVAQALAERLGVQRLDTGAMYRAVTWRALEKGVSLDDADALAGIAEDLRLDLDHPPRVLADGEDVTAQIRTPEVDAAVSQVAANPAVRRTLVARQQDWIAQHRGAVVEGRDIGTVVAPQADLKVYLTASAEERADRRAAQGRVSDRSAVGAQMQRRDRLDSSRAHSPLAVADDALVIDSTGRSVEDVVQQLLTQLQVRGSRVTSTAGRGGLVAGRPIRRGELWFYAAARFLVVGLSKIVYPGKVVGVEHLPAAGGYVLAPVHRSYLDWLVVARVTRRRLRYLVKDQVWKMRPLGRLIELLGAFPVHRGSADREALTTALHVLEGGEPLVVFPEGTRRSGRQVVDVRDGAAYLALRAGVPIVPVGIAGTEAAMPRGARLPRPARVVLVVGEPIVPPAAVPRGGVATGRAVHIRRGAVRATTASLVAAMQSCLDRAEHLLGERALPSAPAGDAGRGGERPTG